MIHKTEHVFANRETPPFHSEEWTSISRLFDRDWFWRVWCVQEVALASDAVMIWGDEIEVAWKWVGLAAARIRTNKYQVLQRHRMAGVFNAYLMYRISLNASDLPPLSLSIPFVQLLALTRQFEAKDPRDRIFGLLGLPTNDSDPDQGRLFIEPDYNISTKETYKSLALKVFDQDRNCDILSSVQHGDTLDLDFPSWVPRWDKVHALVICASDSETTFNACGRCTLPPNAGYMRLYQNNERDDATTISYDCLNLQGLTVDQISYLLPIPANLPTNSTHVTTIMEQVGEEFVASQAREDPKRLSFTFTAGKDWYGTLTKDHPQQLADFKAALSSVLSPGKVDEATKDFHLPLDYKDDADRFHQSASNACKGRTLFFAKGGRLGLGPMAMQEGDSLCVLFGGSVPYILRAEGDCYRLVGECYVYDLMNGEAVALMEGGILEKRSFKLL